jgi:hypothetical protein
MIRKIFFALGAIVLAGQASLALAASTTYYFNGSCSDCTLQSGNGAIGSLVLTDYVEGTPILFENFESFTYNGSNIVFPITVLPQQISDPVQGISGLIGPAFDAPYDFFIEFIDGLRFETSSSGDWYICAPGAGGFYSGTCDYLNNNDFGQGTWSGTTGVVPLPAAAWLFGSALLGLAGIKRRRA